MTEYENITNIEDEIEVVEPSIEMQISDLEAQIESMKTKTEEKITKAHEQLIEDVAVTGDKYLTATGVMSAYRMLDSLDYITTELNHSFEIADDMSGYCKSMAAAIAESDPLELDDILEGFYHQDYVHQVNRNDKKELAKELLALQLCQQVGPAIQDILDFNESANEEIAKTQEKIEELKGRL